MLVQEFVSANPQETARANGLHELLPEIKNVLHHSPLFLERLFKRLKEKFPFHEQTPVCYIFDLHQHLLLFQACSTHLFEHPTDTVTNDQRLSFTRCWNEDDFKIFTNNILPETIRFLKMIEHADYQYVSSSFNYRISSMGKWITILQRTSFIPVDGGKEIVAVGMISDISHFKSDNNITHVIERTNEKHPLVKTVYNPQHCQQVLSKREKEILQCIYEGYSSKEMADKLCVSLNTINNHRKNMIAKTQTKNAPALLSYALRNGLL